MLARTVDVYRTVFDDVAVVIREGEPRIADLVRAAGARVVEAADASLGQSRSLAAGVAACEHAAGVVVGLGDMPFVAPATLRAIAAAMSACPDHIVRPRHAGRPGNPVGFPAHAFEALARIEGDTGARDVCRGERPHTLRRRRRCRHPRRRRPAASHVTNTRGSAATGGGCYMGGRRGLGPEAKPVPSEREVPDTAMGRFHGTPAKGSIATVGGCSMFDGGAGPKAE